MLTNTFLLLDVLVGQTWDKRGIPYIVVRNNNFIIYGGIVFQKLCFFLQNELKLVDFYKISSFQ